MDPNETLNMIREAINDSRAWDAIELFEDLDRWLSRGGFLPAEWKHSPLIPKEISRTDPDKPFGNVGYGNY